MVDSYRNSTLSPLLPEWWPNTKEKPVKRLLVLGAGTAGTMVANKLRPRLDEREWKITLVDQNETHYYQPGLLFLPFGDQLKKLKFYLKP